MEKPLYIVIVTGKHRDVESVDVFEDWESCLEHVINDIEPLGIYNQACDNEPADPDTLHVELHNLPAGEGLSLEHSGGGNYEIWRKR